MSKYEPLKAFLRGRHEAELPLSFADVEETLGFCLPRSARRHAPWWANEAEGSHVQARAWLEAGWRTSKVDVAAERIVFVRDNAGARVSGRSEGAGEEVAVNLEDFSPAADRLFRDYLAEAHGNASEAIARAVHEAAIARRGRLIDRIIAHAPRASDDSVDLIREDRDGG